MRVVAIAALVMLFSATARAQTIETPISFDSAHRVLVVTPSAVGRLGLRAPAWPVTGAFREARLYSVSSGGFTLVVERAGGATERFTLTSDERDALSAAIEVAGRTSARPLVDSPADVVSEPVGTAFARHLTLLSAVAYGPLAASLAEDGSAAGALYVLTTGMTYFISYGASQSTTFTRAQSDLAGELGLAAGAGGLLAGYAGSGNADRGVRALALGTAIAGTIAGAAIADSLSDSEAHGITMGIELGAATGVALSAAAFNNGQASAIGTVVGGAIGLPLGLAYTRHAPYAVTAGDVQAIGTTGLIGAAWAGATLGDSPSGRRTAITLGAGYLAGSFIGERLLARNFDLTRSQSNTLKIGAFAGGLVGTALPLLSDQNNTSVVLGAGAAGATLAVAALAGTFPLSSRAGQARSSNDASGLGLKLSLSPTTLLGLSRRAPGVYPIVRLTF